MRLKGYDVMLLVLAVVTAGAIWLALSSVGSTSAGVGEGGGDTAPQASATSEPTSASATPSSSTDGPTPEDRTGSTSAEPTSAQERPSSAAQTFARILVGKDGEPVDVVVLGDDTSNLRTEWVQQWGQELASTRKVTVVQWAETIDIMYAEPDVLSETGDGGPLTIWSASRTGADIGSVIQRLGLFLEPDPDLVVISLGANNDDADEAVQQLQTLVSELEDRIGDTPVALMRQGKGGAPDEVDQAVAGWAREQGLFVIDARGADSAQEWAELVLAQTL